MRNLKRSSLAIVPVAILSLAGGSVFAYEGAPMTPTDRARILAAKTPSAGRT